MNLYHKNNSYPVIELLWLEITEKCNLRCQHCYADSSPESSLLGLMTSDCWLKILDEASALGVSAVQFIGGEPTLHPDFRLLMDAAGKMHLDTLEVYTNATRMNDAVIGCLRENGATIATSFYTDNAETHDAITSSKGSWLRTVSGIERAKAAGLEIRVGIVETPENDGHVPGAVNFLHNLGISRIGVDKVRAIGRGNRNSVQAYGEKYSQLCGQCGRARLCVTAHANIHPCVFARNTVLGDARNGLLAALNSAELTTFRQSMAEAKTGQEMANCDPNLPCSPQTCNPQLDCSPNRFCSPDNQCQPHVRERPSNI